MVVVKFLNTSGFKKPWALSTAVPRYLVQEFSKSQTTKYHPKSRGFYISDDKAVPTMKGICAEFSADWVLSGKISEYSIARTGIGSSSIISFNSYTGRMQGLLFAYSCQGNFLKKQPIKWSVRDNEMALNVPDSYIALIRDQYQLRYEKLEKEPYGSAIFDSTVGGILNDSLVSVFNRLISSSGRGGALAEKGIKNGHPDIRGQVVAVSKGSIYIDIGLGQGVIPGDSVIVFKNGPPIFSISGGDTLGFEEILISKGKIFVVKSKNLSIIMPLDQKSTPARGDFVRVVR